MSYIYHGRTDWIAQPNRVVKSFRSGLIMITQDYIKRAGASSASSGSDEESLTEFNEGDKITNASPCMEGAYIFPAPDYQDMGNGFTKATVTAYGRINTTGVVEVSKRIGDYYVKLQSTIPPRNSISTKSTKLFEVVTYRFVAKRGEVVSIPNLVTPKIYNTDGSVVSEKNAFLGKALDFYEVTSFGEFNSVVISVVAAGSVLIKVPYEI